MVAASISASGIDFIKFRIRMILNGVISPARISAHRLFRSCKIFVYNKYVGINPPENRVVK